MGLRTETKLPESSPLKLSTDSTMLLMSLIIANRMFQSSCNGVTTRSISFKAISNTLCVVILAPKKIRVQSIMRQSAIMVCNTKWKNMKARGSQSTRISKALEKYPWPDIIVIKLEIESCDLTQLYIDTSPITSIYVKW